MWDKELIKYKSILALNIKTIRLKMGLAQERLALEAGVDRTLVSKIERQLANPSLEILVKLAVILKVPVTGLLE
ncbi:helix-turn-helix transcriptional regulator [Polynucleobacter sp. Latsch14-2]|jgi:transcriptional regulator with XRE-family HTH domain|uniref:helix-turn-helix domain-containing protein n=1 Tax=Polynucleobacter sp. Latsch14-2 TaxID=2576920 RepID=UPI001C0B0D1D|nr:helix-turn-helix transcriptional regulator [Polynucleobacter sp. Latsch14-2]MBU3614462.1 helix-turn-helix transcriptional regulator [Polynucleobacter sp. Latsch14-2]